MAPICFRSDYCLLSPPPPSCQMMAQITLIMSVFGVKAVTFRWQSQSFVTVSTLYGYVTIDYGIVWQSILTSTSTKWGACWTLPSAPILSVVSPNMVVDIAWILSYTSLGVEVIMNREGCIWMQHFNWGFSQSGRFCPRETFYWFGWSENRWIGFTGEGTGGVTAICLLVELAVLVASHVFCFAPNLYSKSTVPNM